MSNFIPPIKKVIYSDPVTVVIWEDGSKTISRCDDTDIYDELTGFMLCVFKKTMSAKNMREAFEKYVYDINSDKIKWESYPTWLEEEWIDNEIVKGVLDDETMRKLLENIESAIKYGRTTTFDDKGYGTYVL